MIEKLTEDLCERFLGTRGCPHNPIKPCQACILFVDGILLQVAADLRTRLDKMEGRVRHIQIQNADPGNN